MNNITAAYLHDILRILEKTLKIYLISAEMEVHMRSRKIKAVDLVRNQLVGILPDLS